MIDCKHEKWECQLFYGAGGEQIHCEVTCETCEQVAAASSITYDGNTLTVKPNWNKPASDQYSWIKQKNPEWWEID